MTATTVSPRSHDGHGMAGPRPVSGRLEEVRAAAEDVLAFVEGLDEVVLYSVTAPRLSTEADEGVETETEIVGEGGGEAAADAGSGSE